jgi:hypothetical protein
MSYTIQSVTLRRDKMSKGEAYKWVRDHGYSANKIDITPHYYRFRQVDPERLRGGRFRSISIGDIGHLIVFYH